MDIKEIPFLDGDVVYCRGLKQEDAAAMANWLNDDDVTGLLYQGLRPMSAAAVHEVWSLESLDSNTISLAACRKEDDECVGTTGLYDIQWVMRSASFRVFIGDKQSWDRGIGTECARLMLRYGFDKLNLNRVWLGVNAANERAVRAYEKAGFVREGLLRQEQFRNGRYYDVVRMAVLRGEYKPANSRG
ncbi:MAG: N-acetyltransferase [Acidobacteria bacterium]|nr:N-acetyltransferase [Acidobacteriota bacterium]